MKKYLSHEHRGITIFCGIFFAISIVLGNSLTKADNFSLIAKNPLMTIFQLLLYFIIFEVLSFLFIKFMLKPLKNRESFKFFAPTKKNFFIHWGIFFVIFFIPFLVYFPGLWNYDWRMQLWFFSGVAGWTTYHPFIHTVIEGVLTKLGLIVFGKDSLLMLTVYPLVQIIGFSAFCAWIMRKVSKFGNWINVLMFLFICFWPQNPYMAGVTTKDTLFAISTVLMLFIFLEAFNDINGFFTNWKKYAQFILVGFLFCITRNNGYAALVVSMPFILLGIWWILREKKALLKMLVSFVLIIVLNVGYNAFIFLALDVKAGPSKEALPIPMMQVYKLAIDGDLDEDEMERVKKLFGQEGKEEFDTRAYMTHFADNVKARFDEDEFKRNKGEYIKLYLQLLAKHSIKFIEVGMNLNIAAWYIGADAPKAGWRSEYVERVNNGIPFGIWNVELMHGDDKSLLPKLIPFYDKYVKMAYMEKSVTGWIFKPAVAVYLLFLAFIVLGIKKKSLFLAGIPLFFLWLSVIAAPVLDGRYVYPLVLCTPIVMALAKGYRASLITPS